MIVDDLKTYLVAYLNPFIAALSTTPIPLDSITAAKIILRDYQQPAQRMSLLLDDKPEEIESLTMTTNLVTTKIEAFFFVTGATEATAREQAKLYMDALLNCLAAHADFFTFEEREYFDGVEGKPDVKASRALLVFKYEE